LEAIDFAPAALVREVVALMQPSAAARGNRLLVDTEGLPAFVRGDPTRLRQVLYNLLGNAIKFTREGSVELRCKAAESDDHITLDFSISDTGIGMTPEQRARLFQPFTQADASTSRHFGGTGLGLSICKRLVEAMEGSLEVQSVLGVGSVFSFSIQVRSAQGATPLAAGTLATALEGATVPARILLAEDNAVNRFMIAAMLQRQGHQVTIVENGRLAIEALKASRFDLVLMDMQMPEMDGLSATREIRANHFPKGTLTIIGLSAETAEFSDHHAAAGLDDYLTKPVNWSTLSRAINRAGMNRREPAI
jgi:CheY-like chemotaxis protein